PRAFLVGAALRVPPDVALAVAPRLAVRPRRGAVVHDVPIGRPIETPAKADVVVGLARGGQIAVRRREDARVDPVATHRRAVVLNSPEAAQVVTGSDVVAVDLLQNLERARLVLDAPLERLAGLGVIVPGRGGLRLEVVAKH